MARWPTAEQPVMVAPTREERWQELGKSFMECLETGLADSAEDQAIDLCSMLAMFVPFRYAPTARDVLRGKKDTSDLWKEASNG